MSNKEIEELKSLKEQLLEYKKIMDDSAVEDYDSQAKELASLRNDYIKEMEDKTIQDRQTNYKEIMDEFMEDNDDDSDSVKVKVLRRR